MPSFKTTLVVSLIATTSYGLAQAQRNFGEHVTLSGFGTLGAVATDNSTAPFIRDSSTSGATTSANWKVDSKLGIQADVRVNDWLSGTVQVLSEQRDEAGIKAQFEWAFIRLQPLTGLNLRLGRTAPSVFMISDSRNVGYAQTMVRMPNEVYAINSLNRVTGVDASYRMQLAGQWLTVTATAGDGTIRTRGRGQLDTESVRGLNAVLETAVGNFRLGTIETDSIIPGAAVGQASDIKVPYQFSGVGYQYDEGRFLVVAEYVERKVKGFFEGFDAEGWYLMGGYRFGDLTPYVMIANTKSAPLTKALNNAGDQRTVALGTRWDLVSGAALKLQLEHIDPRGTLGSSFSATTSPPVAKTNVYSVALDFVF
jgi:hypothetical protein